MTLRPCLHCPLKANCSRKQAILEQVRGFKPTLVSFRCDDKWKLFPLGCRVEYEFHGTNQGYCGGMLSEDPVSETIQGTVFRYNKNRSKLVVWLDEETPGTGGGKVVVKLLTDRVEVLDEPLIKLCPECGRPEGKENMEKWCCWKCEGKSDPSIDPCLGGY